MRKNYSVLGKVNVLQSQSVKNQRGKELVLVIGTFLDGPLDLRYLRTVIKENKECGWLVLIGPGYESLRYGGLKRYPDLEDLILYQSGHFSGSFKCSYSESLTILECLCHRFIQDAALTS